MSRATFHDMLFRALGMIVLTVAWLLLATLFHDPAATRGAAGWANVMEAGGGLLAMSGGAMLTVLGRHVLDRITVPGHHAVDQPRRARR